ncbi:MAG: hypothetical protein QOF58_3603 [Pseudonocardiales bacterium]|jgi:hypothetical protein|nr:hypothetical protein [Pseudonocardiales bacterium]
MVRVSEPSSNLTVLCGLATNPAAPLPMLLRLADHQRHGSPALSCALLGRAHLPPALARALAGHPETEVRRRLAAHPSTSEEIRCAMGRDSEPIVRAEVAAWPGSWVDLPRTRPVTAALLPVAVYRRLAADSMSSVRAAVGKNRHVPQVVRAVLAGDADPEVRRCAALYGLPPAVLHQLMGDTDRAVRQAALMAAAVHAPEVTVSAELAAIFRKDSAHYRQATVELVELTPSLLAHLLASPDLHEALARNPSLPPEQMRTFLDDAGLCAALAGNRCLPVPLLEELVTTEDPEVHRELLRRVELPDGLRRRLIAASEDDEPLPMAASLLPDHASLEERLSYLDHPNPAFRRTLAISPDLPKDAVRCLAEDPDFVTRLLICERHSDIPSATLVDLVERWHGHSRGDLLRHPRLPAEALLGHATSDSPQDREAIASRPDLPPELALRLLADPVASVRRTAAGNPNLSYDRLHQLLTDPDPLLREGAASNPVLPVEDMEQLLAHS